jgi:peptide/nickel transport system substrate-binding protein
MATTAEVRLTATAPSWMSMASTRAGGFWRHAVVRALLKAFGTILVVVTLKIPLWERYGNNPVLEGKRVTGWPKEGDPIYQNAFSVDSFVTLLMFDGTLKPV